MRLLIAAVVLVPLAALVAEPFVRACLPAYRAVFELVAPDFVVTGLSVGADGAHAVVAVTVRLQEVILVGGRVVFPDPRGSASASTPLMHALQIPLVAFLVVCAWPYAGWARRAAAGVLVLGLATPVTMFDAPVVLAATLWSAVVDGVSPGTSSWLFPWSSFLLGGGRWVVGGLLGLFAIGMTGNPLFGNSLSRRGSAETRE